MINKQDSDLTGIVGLGIMGESTGEIGGYH